MRTEAPPGHAAAGCLPPTVEQNPPKPQSEDWRDVGTEPLGLSNDELDWVVDFFTAWVCLDPFDAWCCATWQERLEWSTGTIQLARADLGCVEKNAPIAWFQKPRDPSYRKTLLIAPVDVEVTEKGTRGRRQTWKLKPTEPQEVRSWIQSRDEDCWSASYELSGELSDAARAPLAMWQPELGRFL